MKKMSFGFIVLVYSIVLGCASSANEDIVSKAGQYFQYVSEFPYKEIQIDNSYKDEISAGSDVFDFDDGKSFFLAYELPRGSANYQLKISSYMMGEHISKASIFYPTVLLLDENFKVVSKVTNEDFQFKKILFKETWGLPYKYETVIDLEGDDKRNRYMIIYSSRSQRNQQTSVKTMKVVPIFLPGVVGTIPIGKDEIRVKHSPVGKIRVDLKRN